MAAPDLISPATRRAFRDLASSIHLREIDGWWQDEGFAPADRPDEESSDRRNRFRQYEDSVKWADHGHVARALRVFEDVLRSFDDVLVEGNVFPTDRAIRLLDRDGWSVDDRGRIVSRTRTGLPESLANLADPSAIIDGFDRIDGTLPDDPRGAIGAAKELIESTAKVVLPARGEAVDEHADNLPGLITRVQKALLLHPSSHTLGPDGTDAVRKVLGGLSASAIGVAELRNRGYGLGHGPSSRPVGLHLRHAQLAVGAARTWCQMILDTLADPDAPWRKPRGPTP